VAKVQIIQLASEAQLEQKLYSSLRQRHLPDCFLYTGSQGANNWLKLDSSPEFFVARRLTLLLKDNIHQIVCFIGPGHNLASIGVGNGLKEAILLEKWLTNSHPHYYCIDISRELVEIALERVSHLPIEKTGIVAFLEDLGKLTEMWTRPVLLALLGNNFCNYEPEWLLNMLRNHLSKDDLFIFDCHLLKETPETAVKPYKSEINKKFNLGPLTQRGLDDDDCRFELKLLPVQTKGEDIFKIIKQITILKDTEIHIQPKNIRFSGGDIIKMGFTYKYRRHQIENYLQSFGFNIRMSKISTSAEELIILARKQ
jgi:uncharacterized SAM-dependent methyltransferase